MLHISWALVGRATLHALLSLVSNPLLYLGWILYAIAMGEEAKFQRRFFGVRLSRVTTALWAQVWRSLVAGVLLSIGVAASGIVIRPWDVWLLSSLTLVVSVVRLRFIAAPTVIGLMVLLASLARVWQPSGLTSAAAHLWHQIAGVPVYSWLSFAAVICLVEAFLLVTRTRHVDHPVLLESKRGRVIGAISIQLLYVLPVLVVVPGHIPRGALPASWPWLGQWAGSLGLVGLPVFVGVAGMFTGVKAARAVRTAAWHSLVLFALIGGAAALSLWYPHYGWIGGAIALLGRELAIFSFKRWETRFEPLYVPSALGVRLLTVVTGSLADTIGLQAGEVITHVNQVPVHSEYDLHFAYSQNPAYAKLQVLDERGEVRMLGGAVYAGERAKLGVVAAPEGLTGSRYARSQFGLLQSLYARLRRRTTGPEETAFDTPAGG